MLFQWMLHVFGTCCVSTLSCSVTVAAVVILLKTQSEELMFYASAVFASEVGDLILAAVLFE